MLPADVWGGERRISINRKIFSFPNRALVHRSLIVQEHDKMALDFETTWCIFVEIIRVFSLLSTASSVI